MADDIDHFGAMPLVDRLRLVIEWAPVLLRAKAIVETSDPYEQALALVAMLQWAAGKTEMEEDDEALRLFESVLRTTEGRALLMYAARKAGLVE